MNHSKWRAITLTLACPLWGCSSPNATYRAARDGHIPIRSVDKAQQLNAKGLKAVEEDELDEAEKHFKAAIEHDLTYAPAHNNLGLVLLKTERYYEAAWEFEYASKLAPTASEPRDNLGLLFEELGKLDLAIDEFEKAHEIDPQNLATMQHLARAYVKADRKDQRLKAVLDKILLIPDDKQWDAWARGQLVRLGRIEDGGAEAVFPD